MAPLSNWSPLQKQQIGGTWPTRSPGPEAVQGEKSESAVEGRWFGMGIQVIQHCGRPAIFLKDKDWVNGFPSHHRSMRSLYESCFLCVVSLHDDYKWTLIRRYFKDFGNTSWDTDWCSHTLLFWRSWTSYLLIQYLGSGVFFTYFVLSWGFVSGNHVAVNCYDCVFVSLLVGAWSSIAFGKVLRNSKIQRATIFPKLSRKNNTTLKRIARKIINQTAKPSHL